MAEITRFAKGFRALLGLKGGGESPLQTADFVQPTMETFDMYAAQKGPRTENLASGLGAIGATITIPVPLGDLWLIHHVQGRISFGAGGQNYVLFLIREDVPGLQEEQGVLSGPSSIGLAVRRIGPSLNAAGQDCVVFTPPQKMLMASGEAITLLIADATGGFVGVTGRLQVVLTNVSQGPGQSGQFR